MTEKLVNMDSSFELEDRLNRINIELYEIIRLLRYHKIDNKESELKNLKNLVNRIDSHRIDDKDTTLLIREMREKQYDV